MISWRNCGAKAATILFAVPIAFPVYSGILFAVDSLFGDGSFLFGLVYESRGNIWRQFWSDWFQALPWLYLLGGGILGAYFLRPVYWRDHPAIFVLGGAIVGWVLALWLGAAPAGATVTGVATAGAVVAGMLWWVARRILERDSCR